MAINLTRRISAGTSTFIRNICAAAAAETNTVAKVASPVHQQNRKATSPVEIDGNEGWLHRLLSAIGTTGKTVAETLYQYDREGNAVSPNQLKSCIKELRSCGKYHRVLEIMEWMELRNVMFSSKDLATRLRLVSRVHGVAAAETYFSGLPPTKKNKRTYGAILSCYCKEKLADKALALYGKMCEMGMGLGSSTINTIMSLYIELGQPEKVPPLVQDMKKRNIPLSSLSFEIWMQSLSELNDIDGVEQVFEEMMRDNTVKCDWTTYSNLAVVYIQAGLHEKAEAVLKKLEKEMQPLHRDAFHFLITMYATTSNLGEVHRIWNVLKSSFETITNCSYDIVLQSLARLKDIDGLKNCFEEWESSCSNYDVRLANTAIGAYLSSDKTKEAGLVYRRATERSSGPFYIILLTFATFHLKNWEVDLAMRYMDAAVSEAGKDTDENRSCPSSESVDYIMKYFEAERDVDGAEKLCELLKKINCLDNKTYGLLLRTYVAAKKTEPKMRKRMEEDSIKMNSELENLLKKVCPNQTEPQMPKRRRKT